MDTEAEVGLMEVEEEAFIIPELVYNAFNATSTGVTKVMQ